MRMEPLGYKIAVLLPMQAGTKFSKKIDGNI